MYEYRTRPILTRAAFAFRLAQHAGLVILLIVVSMAVGMVGFHTIGHLGWLDAFFNAAMLLGGMGPVFEAPLSAAAKVFAGLYALYCGLAVIAAMSIMLAPVVHRVMHRLHWEDPGDRPPSRKR